MPSDMRKLKEAAIGSKSAKSKQIEHKVDDPRAAFARHQEDNCRYTRTPSGGGTVGLPIDTQRSRAFFSEDPFVPLDESDSEQHSDFY